jgi:hypothetical protein
MMAIIITPVGADSGRESKGGDQTGRRCSRRKRKILRRMMAMTIRRRLVGIGMIRLLAATDISEQT